MATTAGGRAPVSMNGTTVKKDGNGRRSINRAECRSPLNTAAADGFSPRHARSTPINVVSFTFGKFVFRPQLPNKNRGPE